MRKRNSINYIKFSIFVIVLASISALAFGNWYRTKAIAPTKKVEVVTETKTAIVYDTKILARLRAVCERLDASGKSFFLSGKISSVNGADSTENINNANYLLSKSGQNFYCLFGNTETINTSEVYVFADHDLKRILVSTAKQILSPAGMPDIKILLKNLEGEGFTLTDEVVGESEQISLKNDYHVTCKEYTVSFDAKELEPRQIFTRLSDPQHPENKGYDKTITIDIKKSGQYSDDGKYDPGRFVNKLNAKWVLSTGYEKYELIVL
ncbi:hypothetical protein ACXZ1K_05275 [Pedobacter sp. PWIIR3]